MSYEKLSAIQDHCQLRILAAASLVGVLIAAVFLVASLKPKDGQGNPSRLYSFWRFFYASFLKPHDGDGKGNGQQDALESFYRAQADVYDATRRRLLRGREDMLALVAAQLKQRASRETIQQSRKCVWVDIGGGTGYNIEAMSAFVDVPEFFSAVYLVDFSPSLCEVARKRFDRLGWKNVKVVCQDARSFRLEEQEGIQLGNTLRDMSLDDLTGVPSNGQGADLITMSYSLSMIPDYYSVVDALSNLLAPFGVLGVTDFYVQSIYDVSGRNYTGGIYDRHVNWLGRVFWRAWFDIDRVALEAGRRDYLEYRFGTILSHDNRNYLLGGIPFYIWIGCRKLPVSSSAASSKYPHEILERLDAAVTESPYLSAIDHARSLAKAGERNVPEIRSKAYECAIVNLSSNLPLPSFFYQNHHWRIYYDDQLKKHTQFKEQFIYAFAWEDCRVDQRLLKIGPDDIVLAITSGGCNALSYLLSGPKRLHAVDLNPTQNHLLELKVAAFTALGYADVWKLFGEGKHERFREILISDLSPHLSSRAFQYWLDHTNIFLSKGGLYETGGSGHAVKLARRLFKLLGLAGEIRKLSQAKTLNEQRELWEKHIRGVLLSRLLSWAIIGNPKFLWKALGVPPNQSKMIQDDYFDQEGLAGAEAPKSDYSGRAIWEYMVNTLDPVVENTLISDDNYFYLLCLQGKYSRRCHPAYLTAKAHVKLSRPEAFDGLRIHTDEINEVISRIAPGTLTIAVVMDSMDWFDPKGQEAAKQITALNHVLAPGGRVLLRSAGLRPWYIKVFEEHGFSAKRVGARLPGQCIDRVNMYASTFICTKVDDLLPQSPKNDLTRSGSVASTGSSLVERLEI